MIHRLDEQHLGRDDIPCTTIDIDLIQQGELSENAQRVDLLPTESIQLAEVIAEAEKRKAKGRQAAAGPQSGRGKKQTGSGNLPEPLKGRTRDAIGAAVGMSGKTYEAAKAVTEAAKEDPEAYGDLPAMMDDSSASRTGRGTEASSQRWRHVWPVVR